MKLKYQLFIVIAFVAGFLTNTLISQYKLDSQIKKISFIPANSNSQNQHEDSFYTYIEYSEKGFSPQFVEIKKGNYLVITNKSSEKQMWLASNEQLLNTVRGYAKGERLETLLPNEGLFKVSNKNDESSFLTVKVVP